MGADKLRGMEVEVRVEGEDVRSGAPPRVLGRYRVVAELGRGSTSIVYLATVDGPGGFSKLFALKVLRRSLAEKPALVAMFLAEARLGAQLNHPNVVSTLEIEEGGALPFIVMEYLDGAPLQQVITAARLAFTPLPLAVHLAFIAGALEGLAYAHAAEGPNGAPLRVVHRDVSPHNVFVTTSGTAKVLDFGFAQTIDSPDTTLSSAARVAYMSPEQAAGEGVDARSDLFSVGVMVWEAVTRRRFWSEEASKEDIVTALKARALPPNRLTALAKQPDEVRAMVERATAPEASERYETALAFQADLRVVLHQLAPAGFAPRELGQRIIALFASDRARLQRAIEEDRSGLRAPVETPTVPVLPASGDSLSPLPAPPPRTPAPAAVEPIVETVVLHSVRDVEPLPSYPIASLEPGGSDGRWKRWAITLGGLAVAAALAAAFALSRTAPTGRAEPRTATQAPPAAEAVPATPERPSSSLPPAEASAAATAAPVPVPPGPAEPFNAKGSSAQQAPAVARIAVPAPVRSVPSEGEAQRAAVPGEEAAVRVTGVAPSPPRAPHPIDRNNPYATP